MPGADSARAATATDTPVVTVVLDGENAWEHYAGGGRPFLRALYGKLGHAADVKTVTMSEAASGPAERLPRVFPGSWINGDFYIWAGHADDHRAWRQLAEAHARFDERSELVAPDARAIAAEELRIAEGSDWFWWYGDDHSSDQDAEFDDLYRRHLRNCYVALGLVPPDELFASNITTGGSKLTPVVFRSLDTPAIGGAGDHIGDWARAVRVPLRGSGGTMHQVSGQLIKACRLAVDRSTPLHSVGRRRPGPSPSERRDPRPAGRTTATGSGPDLPVRPPRDPDLANLVRCGRDCRSALSEARPATGSSSQSF